MSNKTSILQISDLHKFSLLTHEKNIDLIEKLVEELNEVLLQNSNLLICICGDITDRGDPKGYINSKIYINLLCDKLRPIYKISILAVPGNHDICKTTPNAFIHFNKVLHELRDDTKISFNKHSIVAIEEFGLNFILINSSYRENPQKGSIDIDKLRMVLQSNNKIDFVLVHHHLIPVIETDSSTIANTYEFLKLIEYYKIKLILHGHQHMSLNISMGNNNCRIIGVGSIASTTALNTSNQFNLHSIDSIGNIESNCFKFESDVIKKRTIR